MDQPVHYRQIGDSGGFLQAVVSFAVAGLVMLGVGGTVYKLVMGPVAGIFGRSVAGGLAVLFALMMIGISIWLTRAWISARARKQYSEIFVYSFAATGLVYAVQAAMESSL
jgi:hypothetical protein